jgi:hypothetical protein
LGNDSKGLSKVRQCRVEVPRRPDTWSGRGKHYLLQVPCLRSWVCECEICRCYILIDAKIQGGQLSGPHSSYVIAIEPGNDYAGAYSSGRTLAQITLVRTFVVAMSTPVFSSGETKQRIWRNEYRRRHFNLSTRLVPEEKDPHKHIRDATGFFTKRMNRMRNISQTRQKINRRLRRRTVSRNAVNTICTLPTYIFNLVQCPFTKTHSTSGLGSVAEWDDYLARTAKRSASSTERYLKNHTARCIFVEGHLHVTNDGKCSRSGFLLQGLCNTSRSTSRGRGCGIVL